MVCIYCGNGTNVMNSRPQTRTNSVWRRRHCTTCEAIFTSIESVGYAESLAVQISVSHIVPFQRDLLYLSVYDACRHRPNPVSDATALTDTIIHKLLDARPAQGIITRDSIIKLALDTLHHFDEAAAVHYQAFHPPAVSH